MSTKIYNGYKINNIFNLVDLRDFIKLIKPIILKNIEEYNKKIYSKLIQINIDGLIFNFNELEYENEKTSIFQQITKNISKLRKKIEYEKISLPLIDLSFSLTFFILKDKILVLLFTEQKEFKKFWEEIPQVQYYGYWNNTDPDEDCNEEEWNQRELDWDEALEKEGISSLTGLNFDPVINWKYTIYNSEIIKDKIKEISLESRIEFIKNEISFKYFNKKVRSEDYKSFLKWKETEDYKNFIEDIIPKIKENIIIDLNKVLDENIDYFKKNNIVLF